MAKIAVLGLGAMGARMAANLIKSGHDVTVWNRTPAAVDALIAYGARQAITPKAAAADAEVVMSMLRDNDASRQVWLDPLNGALQGMRPGTIAIESSTLTADWVRELGACLAVGGISLLEAPVSGSLPQAESAQLIYLVGGDGPILEQVRPLLQTMGAAIHFVGPLGAGALTKLTTNTLLGVQVAVLAELIGMLEHAGADVVRSLEVVAATPVWSMAAQRVSTSMLSGNFTPLFPIELIEKDFDYTLQTMVTTEAAPTIAAARGVFRQAMAQGLGKENMTSVVKLFS